MVDFAVTHLAMHGPAVGRALELQSVVMERECDAVTRWFMQRILEAVRFHDSGKRDEGGITISRRPNKRPSRE